MGAGIMISITLSLHTRLGDNLDIVGGGEFCGRHVYLTNRAQIYLTNDASNPCLDSSRWGQGMISAVPTVAVVTDAEDVHRRRVCSVSDEVRLAASDGMRSQRTSAGTRTRVVAAGAYRPRAISGVLRGTWGKTELGTSLRCPVGVGNSPAGPLDQPDFDVPCVCLRYSSRSTTVRRISRRKLNWSKRQWLPCAPQHGGKTSANEWNLPRRISIENCLCRVPIDCEKAASSHVPAYALRQRPDNNQNNPYLPSCKPSARFGQWHRDSRPLSRFH